jgi:hypothetical protein
MELELLLELLLELELSLSLFMELSLELSLELSYCSALTLAGVRLKEMSEMLGFAHLPSPLPQPEAPAFAMLT